MNRSDFELIWKHCLMHCDPRFRPMFLSGFVVVGVFVRGRGVNCYRNVCEIISGPLGLRKMLLRKRGHKTIKFGKVYFRMRV